jgi:hypothetical protein
MSCGHPAPSSKPFQTTGRTADAQRREGFEEGKNKTALPALWQARLVCDVRRKLARPATIRAAWGGLQSPVLPRLFYLFEDT